MRASRRSKSWLAGLGAALLGATGTASALDAPPIKPGLWQIHSERSVNGRAIPAMDARMDKMPPEMRARMEAMMKERGVAMGGGGDIKVCLSAASLSAGEWQGRHAEGRCSTEPGPRTATSWKWRSVCTNPTQEVDGEAVFQSPERYTVKLLMKVAETPQGKPRQMEMNNTSTWLSADCGGLKPVDAKTLGAPGKTAKP